jgi:two-component system sensor histidine kinase KdpD
VFSTIQRLTISHKLSILATLFIVAMVAILFYTRLTFEDQKADAQIINIAGRQRMLNQMFMKELVLARQGHEADYRYTAEVWKGSLEALLHGGQAVLLGTKEAVPLPATTNAVIRDKLLEQQRLINEFVQKGEAFIALPEDETLVTARLKELQRLHARLNDVSLAAARLFHADSEAKVASMLRWELALGLCVALLGWLLTVQIVRASRELVDEVAQRKRAEDELRRSEAQRLEAFRQSDELKSALLSLVSHELRTPLTTIKSSVVSLMASQPSLPDETRLELLRGIDEEVDYLDRLVDNLLDMSRIEAGQLVPNRAWHPIEDLIEGALRRSARSLEGRPIDLQLVDGLPPVHVDAVEMQQVLVNLLDNAVKYSAPASPIRLTVRPTDGALWISVTNQGEGVPAEEIDRVFDRFHRVRSKRDRSVRGSGLGLALCRGIVAAHGGRIWMESKPGDLTTVTFSIPTTQAVPELLNLPAAGEPS